ncbi:MAG TPA: ABC transporter permease [Vicinamibacterales bacterium]|nr:ABC transporter permease [Vicinamibacterales bacterium]
MREATRNGRPALSVPIVVIDARHPAAGTVAEAWRRRELLFFLVWRDLKVRYKQTALGVTWAVLQPLATMVVFSIFFGRLAKMPSDGVPYPLFAFTALVPWTYFAGALAQGSNALLTSQALVSKVYFPRMLLPLASVVTPLVDAGIGLVVLGSLSVWYGHLPGMAIVWLPAFALLAVATAFGVVLFLAALNVVYRDVRYVLPFLTQIWLFATPVAYPASLLPEQWRWIYALNPMVSVIEGFRWALLGTTVLDAPMLAASVSASAFAVVLGVWYFRRLETTFADVI